MHQTIPLPVATVSLVIFKASWSVLSKKLCCDASKWRIFFSTSKRGGWSPYSVLIDQHFQVWNHRPTRGHCRSARLAMNCCMSSAKRGLLGVGGSLANTFGKSKMDQNIWTYLNNHIVTLKLYMWRFLKMGIPQSQQVLICFNTKIV